MGAGSWWKNIAEILHGMVYQWSKYIKFAGLFIVLRLHDMASLNEHNILLWTPTKAPLVALEKGLTGL